jgi:tetratricopeptide (TPR) repeat protein
MNSGTGSVDHDMPQGNTNSVAAAAQHVTANAGFAYGVIGADIHVLGDGTPLYVLESYRGPPPADSEWLRELPSRMLNARLAVVDFTARDGERDELSRWCHAGPRLAARWLHAPGGQGKTRLAAWLAQELTSMGWKVVTVSHGPGSVLPPPGSQDMRLSGAEGLLMIIDYADRWPLTHLNWLFSNALLWQTMIPARVMLIARTAYAWPAVRRSLDGHQAAVSQQFLEPLLSGTGEREQMFFAARDSFAARYGIADAESIGPPVQLDDTELGLSLTLHMAALVAVDAHVNGCRPPQSMAGLTGYLLDRERQHWTRLYENRTSGLDYRTPPHLMSQVVFTAALTGPVAHTTGTEIISSLDLELNPQRVLTDHTVSYPPADPAHGTVLEPLYPDRLAEDFVALSVPGHPADHPAYAWAATTATTLLARNADYTPADWTARALTLLATAAQRWPHLREACLYPLLRNEPQLAVYSGAPALTALAGIDDIDIGVLEEIESWLPDDRHIDLDVGIAAIAQRLVPYRLARTVDPLKRAQLHIKLGLRLTAVGLYQEAQGASEQVVQIYRDLQTGSPARDEQRLALALGLLSGDLNAQGLFTEALATCGEAIEILRRLDTANPGKFRSDLAIALDAQGQHLAKLGRMDEAVVIFREAVETFRERVIGDSQHNPTLARMLGNLGGALFTLGQRREGLATSDESVRLYRHLAETDSNRWEVSLGVSLRAFGQQLSESGRLEDALAAINEALKTHRRWAVANPGGYQAILADSLITMNDILREMDQSDGALASIEEAIEMLRPLVKMNPASVERTLATALDSLGTALAQRGMREEALAAAEESVELQRRLYNSDRDAYGPNLAIALINLGRRLAESGRAEAALGITQEAVDAHHRLAGTSPGRFEGKLAISLTDLGSRLLDLQRVEEAVAATRQAVQICRSLAAPEPDAIAEALAAALSNLGLQASRLGHDDEALAATDEAVGIYRGFVLAGRPRFKPDLANTLHVFASVRVAGETDLAHALDAAAESVDIYDDLAGRQPEAFTARLTDALATLADVLDGLDTCDAITTSPSPEAEGEHMPTSDQNDRSREPSWLDQAMTTFRETLDLIDPGTDPGTYGVVLHDIGDVHKAKGDLQEAIGSYREAVSHKQRADNPGDLATTMLTLGNSLIDSGDLTEARTVLDQTKQLLTAKADAIAPALRFTRVHDLGRAYERLGGRGQDGAYPEALTVYQEALKLVDADTDSGTYGVVLHDIGDVHDAMDNPQEAISSYREAVSHKQRADNPGSLATTMLTLANRLTDSGDLTEARTVLDQTKQLLAAKADDIDPAVRFAHVRDLGHAYTNLADQEQDGAYTEAVTAYQEALKLVDADAEPGNYGRVLRDIGNLHQAEGRLTEAATSYRDAVRYLSRTKANANHLVSTRIDLGRVYAQLGQREERQ